MGFDVIIQDMDIPGVQHREYWLDSVKDPIQSEWIDTEHTKFVAVIDGKLKRFKIITRVYCMTPKVVPEVPAVSSIGMKEMNDIIQDLNAVVDSKDHSEVLRLIEAAKEKLGSFGRIRCPVCDGRGTLPYGFYPGQPRDATDAGSTTQCRSCMGRGIVVGGA